MVEKHVYNTILSLLFSPCKHFLAAGNIYGEIGVYLMKDIFSAKGDDLLESDRKPKRVICTPNNEKVCSLASSKQYLIAGTVGEIYAWEWSALPKKGLKVSWNISIPLSKESQMKVDVNSLLVIEESSSFLFAGCGDCRIYMFSLEDGREIRAMEGHTDYIHGLASHGNEIGSCGEEGEVKLWDPRKAAVVANLTPSSHDHIARPHLGKWISDLDFNSSRLICGGGPMGSLWDLRTLKKGKELQGNDEGVHVAKLWSRGTGVANTAVVTAGLSDQLTVFDIKSGAVGTKLPSSSSPAVYTASLMSDQNEQVIAYAGASNTIDIARNFKKRTHILTFS